MHFVHTDVCCIFAASNYDRKTMQRLRYLIFLAVILAGVQSSEAHLDRGNRALSDTVSMLVDNIDEQIEARNKHLVELKKRYQETSGRARIESANEIAVTYLSTNLDTAAQYFRLAFLEARRHGLSDTMAIFQYKYQSLLPGMGVIKEPVDWFEKIDTSGFNDEMKRMHWLAGSQIYYTSYIQYPSGPLKRTYLTKARSAVDSLRVYYPPTSSILQYIDAIAYMLGEDSNMAAPNFINALPGLGEYNELADNAMLHIAEHYKGKPEYYQAYMRFLLQRVKRTLERGVVRPDALVALADELKGNGYKALADDCYMLALSNEDLSYLRVFNHYDRNNLWKEQFKDSDERFIRQLIISVLLLLLLVAAVIVIIYERKINRKKEAQLKDAAYDITLAAENARLVNNNLIELMFLASEQLREYNLFVLRKLKAGQSKTLFEEIETGKYQSRLQAKFFEVFDSEFLKAFPDFIERLNSLLQPDKQVKLLSGDRFTPELRIAAFIRLGITDSSRISGVLNLSLNTIYTYRNRLRSRAIDRDNFDAFLVKTI